MAYNAARFGSPFDFGANYNLTSNDMTHRGFRIGRLAPALFTYFLSLPVVQAVFPYLAGTKMQTNFMGMTITEVFYGGALVSLPLLWAFAALPLLRRRMARQKDLRAMVLLPVLLAVILAALDCQMAGVLYRYLSDYLTPLLFAAALVWLWAESALPRACRPPHRAASCIPCSTCCKGRCWQLLPWGSVTASVSTLLRNRAFWARIPRCTRMSAVWCSSGCKIRAKTKFSKIQIRAIPHNSRLTA